MSIAHVAACDGPNCGETARADEVFKYNEDACPISESYALEPSYDDESDPEYEVILIIDPDSSWIMDIYDRTFHSRECFDSARRDG